MQVRDIDRGEWSQVPSWLVWSLTAVGTAVAGGFWWGIVALVKSL